MMDDILTKLYTNLSNPTAYTSIDRLYKSAKRLNKNISMADVKNYLAGQDTYTLHKPAIRTFKRNRVYAIAIDEYW